VHRVSEVLNRLAGQSGPSFRGDQQAVMEHIVSNARSAFYIAPCDAGKSLVLCVLAAWTRRIVVVITPTNTLAASHCTAVTAALGIMLIRPAVTASTPPFRRRALTDIARCKAVV